MAETYSIEELREVRKQRNLTLEELAEMTGLSVSAISLIETGKRQPKLDSLSALASALKCNFSIEIKGEDDGSERDTARAGERTDEINST